MTDRVFMYEVSGAQITRTPIRVADSATREGFFLSDTEGGLYHLGRDDRLISLLNFVSRIVSGAKDFLVQRDRVMDGPDTFNATNFWRLYQIKDEIASSRNVHPDSVLACAEVIDAAGERLDSLGPAASLTFHSLSLTGACKDPDRLFEMIEAGGENLLLDEIP